MKGNSAASKDTTTPVESDQSWSAYKRVQVRCKQAPVDDIVNLPDFADFCRHDHRIHRLDNPTRTTKGGSPTGDDDAFSFYQGPMYGISGFPGFVYCPQALSDDCQTNLAFQAVTEYCEAPHATNIDLVPPKSSEQENGAHESMWNLWKAERIAAKGTTVTTKKYRSFRKLSWATTGYHYDWTKRAYHEGGAHSPMPESLNRVAGMFARTALAMHSTTIANNNGNEIPHPQFTPSASIVNYYNLKSVMGGHRDDLEYALDKPVVSISLGLPAIFLLGGTTKDDTPVLPILVRPGDVMLLGGAARLNFHGMARVLSSAEDFVSSISRDRVPTRSQQVSNMTFTAKDDDVDDEEGVKNRSEQLTFPDENDEDSLRAFLSTHRININVRQVYKD